MKFKKSYTNDTTITEDVYDNSYPKEPIGGTNPYWCCASCGKSDPAINGRLQNHHTWCEYRFRKESEV